MATNLDGSNDNISVVLPALSNFTISLWVQHNGTDADYDRIIGATSFRFELAKAGNGDLRYYAAAYGAATWQNVGYALTQNEREQITMVRSGTGFYLYTNGNLVYTRTITTSNVASSTWRFGCQSNSTECANISLDDLRIYNTALTPDQVTDLYIITSEYMDGDSSANSCDDSEASVNPIAEEICDGLDNDCDGQVDP